MSAPYKELPSEDEVSLWKATHEYIPSDLAAHAGVCFRRTKDYNNSIKNDILKWGQTVKGVQEDKDWVRVTDKHGLTKYLPTHIGVPGKGFYVVAEKTFARESRFPGEAAVATAVWLGAWVSMLYFIDNWIGTSRIDRVLNIAPYVLCCSIAVQVRFTPPIGWLPPLPEGLLSYLQSCSLYATCVCSLTTLFIFKFKHIHLKHTGIGNVDPNLIHASMWLGASILFAVAAFLKKQASEKIMLAIKPLVSLSTEMPLPPRPPAARIHGYLYAMFSELQGAPVFMQKELGVGDNHRRICLNRLETQGNWQIDVWLQDDGKKKAGARPVYLYIHGDYCRCGGSKMTQHVHMMQILASRGWFVVSVQYRKQSWPLQLEDCEAALKWVCGEKAAAMGADGRKIVVSGSGAGGQLAAALCIKAQRNLGIPIMGNVLFYPNLDLKVSSKRSESDICPDCILGAKWGGEDNPAYLGSLGQIEDALRRWPPVFVVHGLNDSVAPVETSRLFLAKLAKNNGLYTGTRPCDFYLEIPGARHSFDILGSDDSMHLFGAAADWCQNQVGSQPNTFVQAPVSPIVPTKKFLQAAPPNPVSVSTVPTAAMYQPTPIPVSALQAQPTPVQYYAAGVQYANAQAPMPVAGGVVKSQASTSMPIVSTTTTAVGLPAPLPTIQPSNAVGMQASKLGTVAPTTARAAKVLGSTPVKSRPGVTVQSGSAISVAQPAPSGLVQVAPVRTTSEDAIHGAFSYARPEQALVEGPRVVVRK